GQIYLAYLVALSKPNFDWYFSNKGTRIINAIKSEINITNIFILSSKLLSYQFIYNLSIPKRQTKKSAVITALKGWK
ncbi:MAG: hypothetical protein ACTILD_09945, partial [Pseudoalteromonas sp.]